MKRFEWYVLGVGLVAALVLGHDRDVCQDASLRYGIDLERCPDGKLRQTVEVSVHGLRRGAPGTVRIAAKAHYTTNDADDVQTVPVPELTSVELSLVGTEDGAPRTLPLTLDGWRGGEEAAKLTLPEVPDGDYKLHVKYATRIGEGELDVDVPLYTPARIHVITDRPLYEPGNTIKFRAVALRARDLAPLDGRPGTWIVTDPSGEVLLEEKAPAGAWGIVAGSFPLDRAAPTGTWKVAWRSAGAIDEVPITVEPFTLPRFRVDAAANQSFYRPGDTPAIKGAVVYSSGAPVAGARLDVQWDIAGDWPPPTEWREKLLPRTATTGPNGRFELALPQIPADLQGTVTLGARIAAVDAAGDRVTGGASVLLSQDGLAASAVTELGNGLVPSFNNRVYVRVTTPDGRAVGKTKVTVRRTWDPTDRGTDTDTDEDGVASLQFDPGPPVNVVIPAKPFRPAPRMPTVRRGHASELVSGEGASLADQVELDGWLPDLVACAKWTDASAAITLAMRVEASGAIALASTRPSSHRLGKCVVEAVRARRLPAGAERMLAVPLTFEDPELSKLSASVEGAIEAPPGFAARLQELAHGARDCLPQTAGDGALPSMLAWRVREGTKEVELGPWIRDPRAGETPEAGAGADEVAALKARAAAAEAARACAMGRIAAGKIALADEAAQDALGLVRFTVELPPRVVQARPQPTTMLGYEMTVSAVLDREGVSTKLRVTPGTVPPLRLRVTPILPQVGDTVTAELIRGPGYRGELPKELVLRAAKGESSKALLDKERRARFTIGADIQGWAEISGGGERALVYVRPKGDLVVSVTPGQDRYRPRDHAELTIRTLIDGVGAPAAVGLFGVDASLGQLVPLPGEGDLARVRPTVETSAPAFGTLDGQALALGRIRGANAAAATVLRVTSTPRPPELDAVVDTSGRTRFDAVEELTDRFYVVLAELHAQARAWEANAPAGEKMSPPAMAMLWNRALTACEGRGDVVTDAYGRRLRLALLPEDLLALVDPQAVIVVGTRLPEDVEPWAAWVQKERP
ncbi:MAG: hypothetical protein KF773_40385 [Deltaproteobacteria bacterium]|nr:hypothetical protein [Deltaproteobacteria bacterium]